METRSTLRQIQADLLNGKLSVNHIVEQYLDRIESSKHLNIYVEVYAKEARQRAAKLDEKIKNQPDKLGKLFGMVTSIKDVLCQEGQGVTAASKMLEGFTSLYSATAVERMLAEDVIIIGRTNCDQFAMGSTNENSVYGPTLNAADPTKVPGGSSGGAAVSVQADTCLTALGSDTGGSVRQPAAFCGVVGLKPTYGRISRYGLLAYASSFDQIGILGRNVEDIACLLEVIAGEDKMDSTSSRQSVDNYEDFLKNNFNKKIKIAYFDTAIQHKSIDADIRRQTVSFIDQLKADGHTVEAVDFAYLDYIIPAYYVLTTAEASSNLSRYDGIRYGYRHPNAKNLQETYEKSRTEGFSKEVKRRIMLGTFVLSAGYYDAYYAKAQKVRRLIQDKTLEILNEYDLILMPTSPAPAFDLGEKTTDPVEMYLADIYTVQANMAGIPAINIPLGTHQNGLPIGIQFMAKHFQEADLLAYANYVLKYII